MHIGIFRFSISRGRLLFFLVLWHGIEIPEQKVKDKPPIQRNNATIDCISHIVRISQTNTNIRPRQMQIRENQMGFVKKFVGFLKALARNYRLLKTSWNVQWKLFFQNSTLHGVRYIAERGRPFIEK